MSAPPNVAVSTSISSSGGGMGGFSQNGHHHHHHHQVANHQVVPQPSVHNHVASSQGIIHQQQQPPPSPTGNVGHVTHQQAPPPQQPTTMNHGPSVEVSFPLSREKACRFREIAESDHKLIRDLQKFGIHSIRFQGRIRDWKNVRYLKLVIVLRSSNAARATVPSSVHSGWSSYPVCPVHASRAESKCATNGSVSACSKCKRAGSVRTDLKARRAASRGGEKGSRSPGEEATSQKVKTKSRWRWAKQRRRCDHNARPNHGKSTTQSNTSSAQQGSVSANYAWPSVFARA